MPLIKTSKEFSVVRPVRGWHAKWCALKVLLGLIDEMPTVEEEYIFSVWTDQPVELRLDTAQLIQKPEGERHGI